MQPNNKIITERAINLQGTYDNSLEFAIEQVSEKRTYKTQDRVLAKRQAEATLQRQVSNLVNGPALREFWPVSVRQVYYTAITHGYITKGEGDYERVQDAVAVLRADGRLDYEAIVDNSREHPRCNFESTVENADDALDRVINEAGTVKVNRQTAQPYFQLIITEGAGTVGQLEDVANAYDVPCIASQGWTSISLLYQLAKQMVWIQKVFKPQDIIIHYCGDYDPTGVQVPIKMCARITDIINQKWPDSEVSIILNRVALSEKQILDRKLTVQRMSKPPKTASSDWTGVGGDIMLKCEMEAIHPSELQKMTRSAIEAFYKPEIYAPIAAAEEIEQHRLVTKLESLTQ
jgi:hypothetical protein